MLLDVLASLSATAARRLRHGPLRPSWSFMFEVSIALLRRTSKRAAALDAIAERAAWQRMKAPPSPIFDEITRREGHAGGVPGVWFEPRSGTSAAVVLYVHGGSFIYGSIESHAELVARLAVATGAKVFSLDYRLAPEHPFPAAQDDVVAAYAGLVADGTPPSRIVLAGDSAGGNLVLTALLRLRDAGEPSPAGVIAISPWVDLARTGGSLETHEAIDWGVASAFSKWARTYLPEGDLGAPKISPIHGDFRGTAPILVLRGECEMLRDQLEDFVEALQRQGVPFEHERFPDMVHGWMTLASLTPEAGRAFDRCARFVASVVPLA